METTSYGIVLTCGTDRTPPGDHKVVDITPTEATQDAVIAALESSGLTAADLRTQILVVFGNTSAQDLLAVYATLLGFAGRRLHVALDGKVFDTVAFDAAVRTIEDAGQPPMELLHVQVGPEGRTDLPIVPFSHLSSPKGASMLRYTKRVRLVVPPDPLDAVRQFVAVAGLRARGQTERLPYLVQGDEPAATEETYRQPIGVDLESFRRAGIALRKRARGDDRGAIVDKVELTARQRRLVEAAAVPVGQTMQRLGARYNEQEDAWHCPRPDRHTNGDQNPSMRVKADKVRCGRCDRERVDSLRLIMDTLTVTPDEAADWLLGPARPEEDPLAALFA